MKSTAKLRTLLVSLLVTLACGTVEDTERSTLPAQPPEDGVVAAPLMARMERIAAERDRLESEPAESTGCSTDEQAERTLAPIDTFALANSDARLRFNAEAKAALKARTLDNLSPMANRRPTAPKASSALRIQQARYLDAKAELVELHRADPRTLETARIALKQRMLAGE